MNIDMRKEKESQDQTSMTNALHVPKLRRGPATAAADVSEVVIGPFGALLCRSPRSIASVRFALRGRAG